MQTHVERRRERQANRPNTDGWEQQLERWGILTNGYRKVKRAAYQRRRQKTLLDRKEREMLVVRDRCPQGRMHHLVKQIGRIENHVQAR